MNVCGCVYVSDSNLRLVWFLGRKNVCTNWIMLCLFFSNTELCKQRENSIKEGSGMHPSVHLHWPTTIIMDIHSITMKAQHIFSYNNEKCLCPELAASYFIILP